MQKKLDNVTREEELFPFTVIAVGYLYSTEQEVHSHH
jgi:hypothetical protein